MQTPKEGDDMATKKKTEVETEAVVETGEAAIPATEIVFPKDRILTFKRYANWHDLLSVKLIDGNEYTFTQVDEAINDFMKGKVR